MITRGACRWGANASPDWFIGPGSISKGKPYRITPGAGEGKKVYGLDDHQQQRYLGWIVEREGTFFALDVPTLPLTIGKAGSAQEAAEVLYEKCVEMGF